MNPLSQQRAKTVAGLLEKPLDLLVIGGGIVGSGIVRDAAMRGLRAGLLEQYDFAFGTSSRSSRLLHGGIRYLAQGRVGLVHEASVEKKIIHHIAPHLADPMPFLFPTYQTNKDWALWKLKVGVKIYDLLCGGRNLGKSSWLTPWHTQQLAPELARNGLTGAVRYFDGFTNDARLVLDTLRSAARHGAMLLNYCRFLDATRKGETWHCDASDMLTSQKLSLQARTIVNASGPWADRVPHSRVKLRLAKGVHLVVDRARVQVPDTVVMTEGKRILFAIPWGERTILGTTDTDYNGALDKVVADAADIQYVLEVTNRFFPAARLSAPDVISSWAGVRPLIADPHGSPSDISRSHEIRNPEAGWWDVAGGKLTTYRLMAEETVDQIVHALKRRGLLQQTPPCRTAKEPLLPDSETRGISGIIPPEFTQGIVNHFCENEWATRVDDVMIRRTSWHYYHKDADSRATQVASWMQSILGWTDADVRIELDRYREQTRLS